MVKDFFTFLFNIVVPPAASLVLVTALFSFMGYLIGPASFESK